MTDPGAPAGNQQQPDPAGDPQANAAAGTPREPAGASSQPDPGEGPECGPATGTGECTPRFEIVPAFPAGRIYDLVQNLDDIAETLARAESALLAASVVPEVSIASAFPADSLTGISMMAALPDLGFLKTLPPAVSHPASFPEPVITSCLLPALPDLSFVQGVSTMLNSWDHGLLGIRQLADNAAALAGPHQALIDSVAGFFPVGAGLLGSLADLPSMTVLAGPHQALIDSVAGFVPVGAGLFGSLADLPSMNVTAGLVGLLESWRETAETGTGLLRCLARAAYRAALRARAAVLHGDDGPVAWFIERWLSMRVTHRRVEAVSAALLEEGWDAGIPEDPDCLLTDLRTRTRRQARVLKPIWETQLNHQAIGTLDDTVTRRNGTLLTVADLVADPHTTEGLALATECEEQRLRLALSRLKPDELQVTNFYARRSELTWAEAAQLAGAADPAAMGERVRRKLKRIGAEQQRRLAQAGRA
jgi:hypothetical protein